jgi:hypothetical protein
MRKAAICIFLACFQVLCAKPYSQRVKIAEETLVQARDKAIPYEVMLDAALDKGPAAFERFILLWQKLDTSGAYFHFFHVYEAAEIAGDKVLAAATAKFSAGDAKLLIEGLAEAHGWLKRKTSFAQRFPVAAQQFRSHGLKVDF